MPIRNLIKLRRYQRRWLQGRRAEWIASQGGACVDCGRTDALQVHHKNPAQKLSHRVWSWSDERRNAELAKCELVCRRCHGIKHRGTNPRFFPRSEAEDRGMNAVSRCGAILPLLGSNQDSPDPESVGFARGLYDKVVGSASEAVPNGAPDSHHQSHDAPVCGLGGGR